MYQADGDYFDEMYSLHDAVFLLISSGNSLNNKGY